jgi:hypothetical protein
MPIVDSAWDSVHTFIRPIASASMGFLAGSENGVWMQMVIAIIAGTVTLDMHAFKASTRLAINTSPEPFSNIVASLLEHAAVIFMFWLFIRHPALALTMIILILVGSFFVIRALWRFVRRLFKRPAANT